MTYLSRADDRRVKSECRRVNYLDTCDGTNRGRSQAGYRADALEVLTGGHLLYINGKPPSRDDLDLVILNENTVAVNKEKRISELEEIAVEISEVGQHIEYKFHLKEGEKLVDIIRQKLPEVELVQYRFYSLEF